MPSSTSSSLLRRSLPFALAGAIGFAVGRFAGPHDTDPSDSASKLPSASALERDHTAGPEVIVATAVRGDAAAAPEDRWKHWAAAARSPQVERELSAALEEMAKRDPERAMELAAKEPNLRSRELLSHAALRGWAASAPDAALAAAMKLRGMDNRAAIAAVLQGSARNPETVIRLGRQITDGSDPIAADYGTLAIGVLADGGHFEEALRFAANGLPANRALWVSEAFTVWARAQPQQALAELHRVTDPVLQREARHGLIAGWAESDPGSLAEYALRESPTEDRSLDLDRALTNWVLRDPAAASQWLAQRDSDPNLDGGLATIANLPSLMTQRPEVAAEWAEAISDPERRHAALRTIGDEWRRRAPAELQQFLQINSSLSAADRAALAGLDNSQSDGQ